MSPQTIEANGVDLCVETFGDRNDPALLLVEGAGASMDFWVDDFCQQLAAGGRFVIRYDNRDTGQSVTYAPGIPPYGLTDLAADAVGVLDAFDIAQAHVVGVSMGGIVAQLVGLDHPERVASLTLVSTTPTTPSGSDEDLPGISEKLLAFFDVPEPDWSDRGAVVGYIVGFNHALAGSVPPFDEPSARTLVERAVDRTKNIASSMTNHNTVINGPERWRERLGEIEAPTLVIHGTEDPLFQFDRGQVLAKEIPGAQLLALDGVGHAEPPRPTWDVVIPALLTHTAPR